MQQQATAHGNPLVLALTHEGHASYLEEKGMSVDMLSALPNEKDVLAVVYSPARDVLDEDAYHVVAFRGDGRIEPQGLWQPRMTAIDAFIRIATD